MDRPRNRSTSSPASRPLTAMRSCGHACIATPDVATCSVCRLPVDVRAELEGMAARRVPLRTIEARVAETGHKARKDAIARHMNNGHTDDSGEVEVRAIGRALKRVLP